MITWRKPTLGTLLEARRMTMSIPAGVISLFSGVATLAAVGPVSRLPSTVGETRMPLPSLEGTWKMVWETRAPSVLSNSRYSPALGMMVKELSPVMAEILSEYAPAQLTRYLA